jgi:hypothetical protein
LDTKDEAGAVWGLQDAAEARTRFSTTMMTRMTVTKGKKMQMQMKRKRTVWRSERRGRRGRRRRRRRKKGKGVVRGERG